MKVNNWMILNGKKFLLNNGYSFFEPLDSDKSVTLPCDNKLIQKFFDGVESWKDVPDRTSDKEHSQLNEIFRIKDLSIPYEYCISRDQSGPKHVKGTFSFVLMNATGERETCTYAPFEILLQDAFEKESIMVALKLTDLKWYVSRAYIQF